MTNENLSLYSESKSSRRSQRASRIYWMTSKLLLFLLLFLLTRRHSDHHLKSSRPTWRRQTVTWHYVVSRDVTLNHVSLLGIMWRHSFGWHRCHVTAVSNAVAKSLTWSQDDKIEMILTLVKNYDNCERQFSIRKLNIDLEFSRSWTTGFTSPSTSLLGWMFTRSLP